jgi:hypothetical protein
VFRLCFFRSPSFLFNLEEVENDFLFLLRLAGIAICIFYITGRGMSLSTLLGASDLLETLIDSSLESESVIVDNSATT